MNYLDQNVLTSLHFSSGRFAGDTDCLFLDVADEGLPNYKIKSINIKKNSSHPCS